MNRIFFATVLLLCCPTLILLAQQAGPDLESSVAGKRLHAYLRAFNSGSDSAMARFFTENLGDEARKRLTLEQRLQQFHQVRPTAGEFHLVKVLENSKDRVRVLVQTQAGAPLSLLMQCEGAEPYRVAFMQLRPADPKDEGIEPMKDDASLVAAATRFTDSLAAADMFSGVILIAKQGEVVLEKAYGLANKEKKIPNIPATRFNLGSMNKSFTQVAILQLAAQGRLSLDERLGAILPDYPNAEAARKVTVRQLLDMTSGIGDFFNERYNTTNKRSLNSIRGYFPLFADKPLLFEPGLQERYSNGGFIVLGAIIEKVSGISYYDYVRTHIFIPAGMKATASFAKDSLPADVAVGYTRNGAPHSPWRNNYPELPQRGSSAGGGYSTAEDLLRYIRVLGDSSIVPAAYHGRHGLGIAGGAPGINGALEWSPASGYAVIVLGNYDPPAAERLAQRLRAWEPTPRAGAAR